MTREKYAHSVVDVARGLVESIAGSCDWLGDDELQASIDWLEWRLKDEWHEPRCLWITTYERAVRAMALEALSIGLGEIENRRRSGTK